MAIRNVFPRKFFGRVYITSRAEGAYIIAYIFAAAAGHSTPPPSAFHLYDAERNVKLTRLLGGPD